MEDIQWIFSGIGTEILSLVFGVVAGGLAGYKIGVRRSGNQKQKAGKNSRQQQELEIEEPQKEDKKTTKSTIKQAQKAGKNSKQVQVGRINDGKQ